MMETIRASHQLLKVIRDGEQLVCLEADLVCVMKSEVAFKSQRQARGNLLCLHISF